MDNLESAIREVPGVLGLAAKNLKNGQEIGYKADDIFFTASTFKVPILVELYRQVDAGIIDSDTRIELTDKIRSPGGGLIKELGSGLRLTIHDLALLMIIVSDNTATDILYDLVGPDKLNDTMKGLGLSKTSLPMSCKDLLYSMYGVNSDDIFEGTQLVADGLAHGRIVEGSDGLSEERSDVSSPRDMIRLLELIYRHEVLSDKSTFAVMDILERQQANSIIPFYLPAGLRVAHKTGGVTSVRCDVGIVFSDTGPYTIALMAKNVTDKLEIDRALARVSEAVYINFNK
jgi:beta-lactamase class A